MKYLLLNAKDSILKKLKGMCPVKIWDKLNKFNLLIHSYLI